MFIGKYNKSVILTYIGAAIAFAGISAVLANNIPLSMICLAVAGICDLFDGVVARRCKRDDTEKEFGIQIDSLVDVVSFLALPSVLGIQLLEELGAFRYPLLIIYILCGIIRLAWFNTSASVDGSRTHYDGLPVTYSALILPVLWVALGFFEGVIPLVVWTVAYAVIAFLFIFNVKIAKPKGVWYGIFGAVAVAVISVIIMRDMII